MLSDELGWPSLGHHGEAYRTVRAIFDTIVEALWRGETVHIVGLGTFSARSFHNKIQAGFKPTAELIRSLNVTQV